jgi:hypothetical protein
VIFRGTAIQIMKYTGLDELKKALELNLQKLSNAWVFGTDLNKNGVHSSVNAAIQAVFHSQIFVKWLETQGSKSVSNTLPGSLLMLYKTLNQRPNIIIDRAIKT